MKKEMQYFIHQTPKEIRLVTVSDITAEKISTQMKGFRIQTGTVETWEKEEKMPANFPEKLLKHGYETITETQYEEHLKTAAAALLALTQEPSGKDYHIVPWETIETQFEPPFLNDVNEYLPAPALRNFCLYPGDTVIEGDLVIDYSELAATAQTASRNIIVNGHLTINGNLDAGRNIETLPQFIYVTGDLRANNLLLSGWLDIIIGGNATIAGTVLGYYGEPGGRLLIKGNLTTTHLLNGFMYQINVEGNSQGTCYSFDKYDTEGLEPQEIKSSFTSEQVPDGYPLAPAVIPFDTDLKEYSFRFETACALLREGQTIFV
ncbi:hypothetical protein [Chitinophaga sp. RAB17]|uniref:hypothetical protein n=1 Tax=Chitinophaga sp. RAB17 TaxID=3233049 RepID=UPI003F8F0DB9